MDDEVRRIALAGSAADGVVDVRDLVHLVPYVEGFLDQGWLAARLAELDEWVTRNSDPVLQARLLHRPLAGNYLIAAIAAGRFWVRSSAVDGWSDPPMGPKCLIQFAVSLSILELHAGGYLDAGAREHLGQRLQGLDDGNVLSVIHEIATFAYLVRRGLSPEPFFLGKASPDEIGVHWRGQMIPVQCKVKISGAGRAEKTISLRAFTTLAGMVAHDIKVLGQPMAIRIGSTGKIPHSDIEFLRQRSREAAERAREREIGPLLHRRGPRLYSVLARPLHGTFSVGDAQALVESFGCHSTFLFGDPRGQDEGYRLDGLVGIDVQASENTWPTLHRSINDAAKQLRGGPPGLVAVHYADAADDLDAVLPRQLPLPVAMACVLAEHPELAGVLVSSEPSYARPGDGQPGQVRIFLADERVPRDFPLRAVAATLPLGRIEAAVRAGGHRWPPSL